MKPSAWRNSLWPMLLLLAACSKSPKQQLLAGFSDSCSAEAIPQVTEYCGCMVKNLDAAFPAKLFNDPNLDPEAVSEAFAAMAIKLAPACKAQVMGPDKSEPAAVSPPEPPKSDQASASENDAWSAIKAEIQANPKAFIDRCVEDRIQSAQNLGGESPSDAESHRAGFQGTCAARLFDLQKCAALDGTSGQQCYDKIMQDSE